MRQEIYTHGTMLDHGHGNRAQNGDNSALDKTPSKSASHTDPSYLLTSTLRYQQLESPLKVFENIQ